MATLRFGRYANMARLESLSTIIGIIVTIATAISSTPSASPSPEPSAVYGVPVLRSKEIHPDNPTDSTQYAYSYDIRDPQTGSYSSKSESRQGSTVYGTYTIQDADGSRQTVQYTADPIRGLNAEVRRNPEELAPRIAYQRVQPLPIRVPVPLPLTYPLARAYIAPSTIPAPVNQLPYYNAPLSYPVAPTVYRVPPYGYGFEPNRYHTSFTAPTHTYAYATF